MIVQVTRGAIVKSAQEAITRGLHLPNGNDKRTFPGLFFDAHSIEPNTTPRTSGTEQFVKSLLSPGEVGVVVTFPITRDNFNLLRGRVFTIKDHNGAPIPNPVYTFDLLEKGLDGLVLINLEGFGEKRLAELNATVGFSNRDGQFTYAPYLEHQRSQQEYQRRDLEIQGSHQEYQRSRHRGLFAFSFGRLRSRL